MSPLTWFAIYVALAEDIAEKEAILKKMKSNTKKREPNKLSSVLLFLFKRY
jgi:hypothetical protein